MCFFDLINGKDVTPNKEFFESPEDKVAYKKASRLGERFNLAVIGIQLGAILTFLKDETITCKVVSKSEVEFRGRDYSLSKAGVIVIQESGYNWTKIASKILEV